MDFSKHFIEHPRLATVISIFIFLTGLLAIFQLPISEYPEVAPPQVVVRAQFPGANPRVIAETVAAPLEEQINGLENVLYFQSQATADGSMSITVTFKIGTVPEQAETAVQNRINRALPRLPDIVRQIGVTTEKQSSSLTMVVHMASPDNSHDTLYLRNYANLYVRDELLRIPGMGSVLFFGGGDYAMRIWLDPQKLASRGMTAGDVIQAIREQNAQVAAGVVGSPPAVNNTEFQLAVNAQGRLVKEEDFADIIVRSDTRTGAVVRIKDIGRVEMSASTFALRSLLNNKEAVAIGIFQAPGSNSLALSDNVRATMARLKQSFPQGVDYDIVYDPTRFVQTSIEKVVHTLVEAILLVVLVVIIFLQTWRASVIPLLAVPVSIVGTFGVLLLLGYSINTLTLFGLVLAIGIVVDDAIVVVENVERVMTEEGLSPKEATRKSMGQISGALVGIAMVLSAVFVPMAFFSGSTGVIYRQFSVTIVSAMVLSVLVAMVFTPALCATFLKPGAHVSEKGFFGWFNRSFDRSSTKYQGWVGKMITRSGRSLVVYGALLAVLAVSFMRLPTSFLPEEDQGILFSMVQLPTGATQQRTLKVLEKLEHHFMEDEKASVASVFTVAGFSFAGNGQNAGLAFVRLKDWSERKSPDLSVKAVAGRAMGAFSQIREAMVFAFAPPAVMELGNASGFDLQLQDQGGLGHEALMAARNQLLGMAAKNPLLMAVRPNGQEDTPQFKLDIDQQKATALGLTVADVNKVLSVGWGSSYVNDFVDRGRVKRVYLQGSPESRMAPEDLNKWFVRNAQGEMVPFSAFATGRWIYASPRLERYNGVSSMNVQGMPAPGVSSGVAMAEMEKLVAQLPAGIGFEWTGLSVEERDSGSQTTVLYTISVLIVFLCLAALYESWSVPFSVLLVVPLGVIGTVLATWGFHLSNDVYFQVGLLTVVGLSAKNAILIVEFAKELQEKGIELREATLQAVKLRLRPILMTSIAFGLGVLPLAISSGAGSGSQNAIGVGVLGGMLTATFLGIFFVPVFFVVVRAWVGRKASAAPATLASEAH